MTDDLAPLGRLQSTPALEASTLYRRLRPQIDAVLGRILHDNHPAPITAAPTDRLRVAAWNVERGSQFDAIRATLATHTALRDSDLLLLTELDHGMARSGNRNVAGDLARALGLGYVWAPSYLSLAKGSGLERSAGGDNAESLHGNAILSRWPLRDPFTIALSNGKDKMRGSEKRIGCQRAVVATVDHPLGPVRAVSVHLDCHSSRRHRREQMETILDALDALDARDPLPVVIGGDWNTSTHNTDRAYRAILGFWRRYFMGVDNVINNHYPHPDRHFERALFAALERRGFRYRDANQPGACTFVYDVRDLALNSNLGEWVPALCFPFIRWALARAGGRCALKLDWFAVRGLTPIPDSPRVIADVGADSPRPSDHLPILVDLARQPATQLH